MLLLEKIKEIIYDGCTMDNPYTMHETIYLLQKMGLNVSNYRFMRLTNQIISLELRENLNNLHKYVNKFTLKKSVERVLKDFKNYIDNNRGDYTFETFIHALALLHYIKEYCSSNPSVEQIFKDSISEELYNHVIVYVPEIDKFCYAINDHM